MRASLFIAAACLSTAACVAPPGYGYAAPPPQYAQADQAPPGPPPNQMPPPGAMPPGPGSMPESGPPPQDVGPGPAVPPGAMSGPPGQQAPHMKGRERFEAANTTHDGRLTLAQAQAAGWHAVVRHFQEIDHDQKGYVTFQDIREWHRAMKAAKMQAQSAGAQPQGGPPPAGAMPPPPGGPQY